MIIFNNIRTKRLAVRLCEISTDEAISVCRLPADRHEATTTEFLRCVAKHAEAPQPGYVTDPRLMTVEERAFLVCNYLARVSAEGADFRVGETGKLTDYVNFGDDLLRDRVVMGVVAGVERFLVPLLGLHAEILEQLCSSRGDWVMGMLACQIHEAGKEPPDYPNMASVALLEWCSSRIAAIRAMPESEFEEMYVAYARCKPELRHFFVLSADDHGIAFDPQLEAQEAGQNHPARFRALSCISEFTRRIFG